MTATLRDVGLSVARAAPWLDGLLRRIYGGLPQQLQDTPTSRLRKLFEGAEVVRFIQIGAFDGVAGDPIHPLVTTDMRWRGALIEPQPAVFERLRANYRDHAERLMFLQCAISDHVSALQFHAVPQAEIDRLNLPDWAGEVASFDRDHVQRHFPQARLESRSVEVATIADVVRRLGVQSVDLVVMDVEGHERPIIQSIDWIGLGVQACIFEHKHMSAIDLKSIDGLFTANGFDLKRFGRDTLAFKSIRAAA